MVLDPGVPDLLTLVKEVISQIQCLCVKQLPLITTKSRHSEYLNTAWKSCVIRETVRERSF